MSVSRSFRFGIQGDTPPDEWLRHAARAEALGYDVLSVGEHTYTHLGPIPALMSAAMATSSIRLGTVTLGNDFHNPVILARDIATLDVLSGGRLEFGLGTGFFRQDYQQTGIPLDSPGARLDRFFEAVLLINAAFREETVDHAGEHYPVSGLSLVPKPLQRPAPPLLIGGGGRRMLQFAAREADIVSINIRTTPDGWLDWSSVSPEATARKIAWVREAAGDRFSEIELHWLITRLVITDDREAAARAFIEAFSTIGPVDVSPEDILASPHILIGSEDAIVESIQRSREEYGVSYISVFGDDMEAFSPIVARLAGT
jgi:probable F420-dependent oxidoreductase